MHSTMYQLPLIEDLEDQDVMKVCVTQEWPTGCTDPRQGIGTECAWCAHPPALRLLLRPQPALCTRCRAHPHRPDADL